MIPREPMPPPKGLLNQFHVLYWSLARHPVG